ncbi:penicillin-binding protein 1B [Spectribacter hydrogenoxidans]|uniref:Penicillin-binding protein 1B n=1 Tax=Spectribacter hydrogenoxidans TaxID=3075608 RepID=A0ABU3C1V0_9GAMM|nr:penicillin-binding protein 1B [Salinisphaera sp. W335]MDT0635532.1 penicillin-binding protein 1B [Salinisphaera sp. W335]
MARSRRKSPARGRRRWLIPVAVILCAVMAVAALYTVYLDVQVRGRFEGARWTLPAKVYADPVELYIGQAATPASVVADLTRQGYRRDQEIDAAGTFRASAASVDLHTRAFDFWDGHQPDRRLRLAFGDGRIRSLTALDDGDDPALMRLDPMLIGSIYPTGKGEDRILVKLGEVPPMLPAGLIMVEDRNFMDHFGVSPKAILRAAVANLRAGGVVQGGSTITQQLVKNFYLTNQQTLVRKAKEALMAILLDAHYDKEAILEAYLNEVYLGQEGGRAIHGFGLASYFYFAKPVEELQPHEIALLVAMVKGPSYYDPRRHPDRAESRRNLVLDIFEEAGFLDTESAVAARGRPLGVTDAGSRGTSQYPAFIDLVRRQLKGQYKDDDLTEEGLRIFTTLDPDVQSAAHEQVANGLEALERSRGVDGGKLQAAAVVTSVEGGRILALVGGRQARGAGFNRALDAQRPIGSLVKPAVYLTALDRPRQYNVLTPLDDRPLQVELANGDVWEPANYDNQSHGAAVPLYEALTKSYNVATARLAVDLGLPSVVKTLQALGYPGDPIPVPALALGAVEMSPMEVAQIYNTLAAGGYYTPLLAIRAVTTRQGEPLNRYPLQLRRAFDEQSVYLLNWILQRVPREGTARSAYLTLPDRLQVAGKTGTTNELRDSWFAGYGGDRVGVVWVGRDDNQPTPFSGATGALQLWSRMMRDIEPSSFEPARPEGIQTLPVRLSARDDSRPVGRDCDQAVQVPFMAGYAPPGLEPCDAPVAPDSEPADDRDSNWFLDLFR